MTSSGHVDRAAICGLDGNLWAASDQFQPTVDEVKTLIAGLGNKEVLSAGGLRVGGEKFFYLQSDDSQAQGKKGQAGVSVAKSKQCILIATYKDGQQPGNARTVCENLRDYLVKQNY